MLWIWLGFIALVLFFLILDLGVFHRKAHAVTLTEALVWTGIWITVGLTFGVFVYFGYEHHWLGLGSHIDAVDGQINGGGAALMKYLTGYVVEKSLSVDNIFIIAMLFGSFAVPAIYQHRVLFWGIIGALVLRGLMIAVGAKLIAQFNWILYVFGAFLILTAIKMLFSKEKQTESLSMRVINWMRRIVPICQQYYGQHFFVRAGSDACRQPVKVGDEIIHDSVVTQARHGALLATPLLAALIAIEFTDLIFAVDSIPAIFAITADPFLVFTSNVFAILGLRSLYFALAGLMDRFRYLKVSLALVLGLVGFKMLAHHWLKELLGANFNVYLLVVVLLILGAGIGVSLITTRPGKEQAA
ncbi:MAG: TerC/Alx family metal homeostasis membrane protein [Phycisphaerales bacterium]|nr:TerC/Alx family metal homeostasis membrane protein [Phycisphaerales bacterium]